MSKQVMISGYYGFENFGDDLILSVLVHYLKGFGVEPVVLSENPQETARLLDVKSILRTDIPGIWKALESMQAFISGGGGLFQDVTGPASPLYYGGLIEMARWRRVPVAMFGQGIGPIRTGIGRFMTRRAVKQAQLVVVRDVKSQALLQQLANVKAELMADPVWLWQPPPEYARASRASLGVSLRPWPSLDDDAIRRLGDCIAQLPQIKQVGVNLIDCQAGADIVPLSRLEQVLKNHGIPCRWFSESNCALGIASSSAVLGMRYHAVLVAAQLGIPLVTFSYDPKVQLLSAQLKLADIPLDTWETLTADKIRESIQYADTGTIEDFQQSAARGFGHLKNWLVK